MPSVGDAGRLLDLPIVDAHHRLEDLHLAVSPYFFSDLHLPPPWFAGSMPSYTLHHRLGRGTATVADWRLREGC
jgi:hypothetical protein